MKSLKCKALSFSCHRVFSLAYVCLDPWGLESTYIGLLVLSSSLSMLELWREEDMG